METNCKCNHQGLRVKLLHPNAKAPAKSDEEATGYDLYTPTKEVVYAGTRKLIKLGIATDIPHGYFGKIFDRSGLAKRDGITTLAGVIENEYRGQWGVILLNTGDVDCYFEVGDRIAQVVLLPYGKFPVIVVDELNETERGEGGFGSTGR